MTRAATLLLAAWCLGALAAETHESQYHDFTVETVANGLEHPWAVAFLPSDDALITERPGRLRWLRDGELVAEPVSGTPEVVAENQGGLLDVVLHPDFESSRYVYLTWAKACDDEPGATTAMGRGKWDQGALADFEILWIADACNTGGRHHGSRLVFDGQGHVFISVGDRGQRHRAQDTSDHAGSVMRLNEDGSVPADNPFAGDPGAAGAVFSHGNRNIQGMARQPETGELWSHEHGPRGGDEVNIIEAGVNYGWPEITYGEEYRGGEIGGTEKKGMAQPLKYWIPSIAPSGMAFYAGDAFPKWQGDMFVGALALTHLARVRFDGREEVEEEKLLDNMNRRIRDVRNGPGGYLYLLTDHGNGELLRLVPAAK